MYKRSSRFGKARFKKNKAPAAKSPTQFFSIFNPHDDGKAPLFNKDVHPTKGRYITVGSIDPGIYHFALRVERWYEDNSIEKIEYCLIDFTKPKEKGGIIPEVGKENFYYINCIAILQEYCDSFLQECQYICIESQLSWAYDMVRLSSHIIAILCSFLKNKGNKPLIVELDPRLKSRLLGAPPKMKKDALKKWAAVKAREYFIEEKDEESLDFMDEMAKVVKNDDLGDVKLMLRVMQILHISGVLPKIHKRGKVVIPQEIIFVNSKVFPSKYNIVSLTLEQLQAFAEEHSSTIKKKVSPEPKVRRAPTKSIKVASPVSSEKATPKKKFLLSKIQRVVVEEKESTPKPKVISKIQKVMVEEKESTPKPKVISKTKKVVEEKESSFKKKTVFKNIKVTTGNVNDKVTPTKKTIPSKSIRISSTATQKETLLPKVKSKIRVRINE